MVANESWKIHYLLFPGSPSCSSLFAPLCIHMSKHFAVSCSSFSAAYLNQFKLSLQQQRQQLGKAHVAPTAVTLCLPLSVAICQLAIIKDCPAANAVLFPLPSSLLPSCHRLPLLILCNFNAQFLSLQSPGLGPWHAPSRPGSNAFSSDLRDGMQIQFQKWWR